LDASFPRTAGESGHAAITPKGRDLVVASNDGTGSGQDVDAILTVGP
jgi:hypothetical protein